MNMYIYIYLFNGECLMFWKTYDPKSELKILYVGNF